MMVIGDVAAPLSATGEDGPPGMVSQPAAPMTLIATKVVGETDAADKVKAPSVTFSVPVTGVRTAPAPASDKAPRVEARDPETPAVTVPAPERVKAPSVEESVPVTVIAAELVSFRYPGAARC